jgi:hypothetical protein
VRRLGSMDTQHLSASKGCTSRRLESTSGGRGSGHDWRKEKTRRTKRAEALGSTQLQAHTQRWWQNNQARNRSEPYASVCSFGFVASHCAPELPSSARVRERGPPTNRMRARNWSGAHGRTEESNAALRAPPFQPPPSASVCRLWTRGLQDRSRGTGNASCGRGRGERRGKGRAGAQRQTSVQSALTSCSVCVRWNVCVCVVCVRGEAEGWGAGCRCQTAKEKKKGHKGTTSRIGVTPIRD